MDLVIDANALFATLIREGKSHEILFSDNLHIFGSEYLFEELEEHKDEIIKKSHKSESDFYTLLNILKKRIHLIPLEELVPFLDKADEICPDPDDVIYFALALKLKCSIWSNDKALKEQESIEVYSTSELIRLFLRDVRKE